MSIHFIIIIFLLWSLVRYGVWYEGVEELAVLNTHLLSSSSISAQSPLPHLQNLLKSTLPTTCSWCKNSQLLKMATHINNVAQHSDLRPTHSFSSSPSTIILQFSVLSSKLPISLRIFPNPQTHLNLISAHCFILFYLSKLEIGFASSSKPIFCTLPDDYYITRRTEKKISTNVTHHSQIIRSDCII